MHVLAGDLFLNRFGQAQSLGEAIEAQHSLSAQLSSEVLHAIVITIVAIPSPFPQNGRVRSGRLSFLLLPWVFACRSSGHLTVCRRLLLYVHCSVSCFPSLSQSSSTHARQSQIHGKKRRMFSPKIVPYRDIDCEFGLTRTTGAALSQSLFSFVPEPSWGARHTSPSWSLIRFGASWISRVVMVQTSRAVKAEAAIVSMTAAANTGQRRVRRGMRAVLD